MKEEVKRLRPIAYALYDTLLKTESITHAQRTCEVLKAVIQGKMIEYWAKRTVGDLGLMEELTNDKTMKDRDVYVSLIDSFAGVAIPDAMKIIDGMNGSIEGYLKKQNMTKPFTDISAEDLIGHE